MRYSRNFWSVSIGYKTSFLEYAFFLHSYSQLFKLFVITFIFVRECPQTTISNYVILMLSSNRQKLVSSCSEYNFFSYPRYFGKLRPNVTHILKTIHDGIAYCLLNFSCYYHNYKYTLILELRFSSRQVIKLLTLR